MASSPLLDPPLRGHSVFDYGRNGEDGFFFAFWVISVVRLARSPSPFAQGDTGVGVSLRIGGRTVREAGPYSGFVGKVIDAILLGGESL